MEPTGGAPAARAQGAHVEYRNRTVYDGPSLRQRVNFFVLGLLCSLGAVAYIAEAVAVRAAIGYVTSGLLGPALVLSVIAAGLFGWAFRPKTARVVRERVGAALGPSAPPPAAPPAYEAIARGDLDKEPPGYTPEARGELGEATVAAAEESEMYAASAPPAEQGGAPVSVVFVEERRSPSPVVVVVEGRRRPPPLAFVSATPVAPPGRLFGFGPGFVQYPSVGFGLGRLGGPGLGQPAFVPQQHATEATGAGVGALTATRGAAAPAVFGPQLRLPVRRQPTRGVDAFRAAANANIAARRAAAREQGDVRHAPTGNR